ncbi:hypothetical protein AAKU52_002906 [Pedobacter sp. CG_S7]
MKLSIKMVNNRIINVRWADYKIFSFKSKYPKVSIDGEKAV